MNRTDRLLGRVRSPFSRVAYSTQVKLFLILVPIVAVVIGVSVLIGEHQHHVSEREALVSKQHRVSHSQVLLLAEPLRRGDSLSVTRLIETIIADRSFVGAEVYEPGSVLFARVGEPFDHVEPELRLAEPITYASGDSVEVIGTLVTGMTESASIFSIHNHLYQQVVMTLILVFGLTLAMHFAFQRIIGRPVDMMMRAIADAKRGIERPRLHWPTKDEMGQLVNAFDGYFARVWHYQRELEDANTELEARVEARTAEATRLAYEDALTGLPNRRRFYEQIETMVAAEKIVDRSEPGDDTTPGRLGAVIVIDIDRFKMVNDTLGHKVGDRLLEILAKRLEKTSRKTDLIARLGGDEFAVLAAAPVTPDTARRIADRMAAALSLPVTVDGYEVHPGASIGLSLFPDHGHDAKTLLSNADIALFQAKEEGRGKAVLFDGAMRQGLLRRERVEVELRRAIREKTLEIHYQPKIDLATGQPTGFEALARLTSPLLGTVSPAEVFSAAEDRGLVLQLADYIMDQVLTDMTIWRERRLDPGQVAINVHPVEIRRREHVLGLIERARSQGFEGDALALEITEDCVVGRGGDAVVDLLHELRALDVPLSLDDFGTGYASLKHLKDLPITEIKIDRSFIADIDPETGPCAIVRAIAGLAHSLGVVLVAEGVEDQYQVEALEACAPILAQGYYLGAPMPAEDCTKLMRPLPTVEDGASKVRYLRMVS